MKAIIIIFGVIALLLLTSCALIQEPDPVDVDEGVRINFYDADGNKIGSTRASNADTQSLIRISLNKIPPGTASIGFEVQASNEGDIPIMVTYTKADFIGDFG